MSDEAIPVTATNDWAISGVQPGKELTLTPEAATALANADAQVQHATALRDTLLKGILAQAGIAAGTVVDVKQGPPMVLVLQ